jgi:hypothetical protein
MKIRYFAILVIVTGLWAITANAQIKGVPEEDDKIDTTFIFESPRSLITYSRIDGSVNYAYGIDLLISDSGFGTGVFFHKYFTESFLGMANLYISGARKGDEFDYWDPVTGEYKVPNKINRLFKFPLMFGIQHQLFRDKIASSFKPFYTLGFGPTFILSTPYTENRDPNETTVGYFRAFSYPEWYVKPGGFFGIGANVGGIGSSMVEVNIRYFYIPFGDEGLESVINSPIKNFGGLFLSVSMGFSKY